MKNITILLRNSVMSLAGLFLPAVSLAANGAIEPSTGTRDYYIKIETTDIKENRVGYQFERDYASNGGGFEPTAHCPNGPLRAPIYLRANLVNPTDSDNLGFIKLNDYISIKVDILVMEAGTPTMHTIPFEGVSNQTLNSCTPPSTKLSMMYSGSKGKVTFKVTKPIINGLPVPGTALAKIYAGLVNGVYGSQPISQVSIESAIITVPDKCIINGGTPITVDFGNIPGSGAQLNGSNFSQNVPIPVKCEGGSFDTGNFAIRMNIQQASPVFEDQKYLGVSVTPARPDLGIMLRDNNGQQIIPNTFYDMPQFINNQGVWNLTAAPIARSPASTIEEGEFSASATVVAQFQ